MSFRPLLTDTGTLLALATNAAPVTGCLVIIACCCRGRRSERQAWRKDWGWPLVPAEGVCGFMAQDFLSTGAGQPKVQRVRARKGPTQRVCLPVYVCARAQHDLFWC